MKKYFLKIQPHYTKVGSFTIVEVIVTLILMVLVFSISFLAYGIIQSQFNRYVNSTSRQMVYLSFVKAINTDIKNCLFMISTDDGFDCLSQGKTVRYIIQDSMVIRENEHAIQDSFLFKQLHTKQFFKEKEILEIGRPMDGIRMTFFFEGLKYYVSATKDYDALTLISLKTPADARN